MISKGARYIKMYRIEHDLRQEDLAHLLECTQNCITRLEHGVKPSKAMFKKICNLTGMSLDDGWELFFED